MENDLINLILEEKSNPEIANMLNYSMSRIKQKISKLYKKYDVKSRVGLVREIMKEKIKR